MISSWRLEFYSAAVAEVVEGWPIGVRAGFLRIADAMISFGPDLGLPHTRSLGQGLFEIRAKGPEGIGRALFCLLSGKRIRILHAYIKKSRRAPPHEVAIARRRLHEVTRS